MFDGRSKEAVKKLLSIEHIRFGVRLGLLHEGSAEMDVPLAREIAYCVDELSWAKDEDSQKKAVQVIALAWEHGGSYRAALRNLFVPALARLGVGPSTSMLEHEPGGSEGRLTPLSSCVSQLTSTLLQYQYFEQIGGKGYFLSKFQKEVLNEIARSRVVGISAPTSAGKSFALYLAIARHAHRSKKSVIYLVPTISLINQVSEDIRNILQDHELDSWVVRTNYHELRNCCVYVLTQERALPGAELHASSEIGLIVVDEAQNLERVEDDSDWRSKVLFDALRELADTSTSTKIVLSGPRVRDIGKLGGVIFGGGGREISTNQSPVASLTYSIAIRSGNPVLTQYSEFYRTGISRKIANPDVVKGIGQTAYTPSFLGFMKFLIKNLGEESRNIIFSPTSGQARGTAREVAADRPSRKPNRLIVELAEYVANSVHPKYELVDCIKNSVAYHTSKVPPHIRLAVEQAFADGLLNNIVCTTTLLQGVNLPANLVLVRNPKLFVRKVGKGDPELSSYEFANLRGRAGRLMKDFVGRTLVLDQDAFVAPENVQSDFFPDVEKKVSVSYGEIFKRHNDIVREELLSPGTGIDAARFLCTHIRQAVFRHGQDAQRRLAQAGIEISARDFGAVERSLAKLDVSREIVLANRYWDPFDLQFIKDNISGSRIPQLPDDVWTKGIEDVLRRWLDFQLAVAPSYFDKYLGDERRGRTESLSISAKNWAREEQLSEIIKKRRFTGDVTAKVEEQIADIHKHVVYGIPGLLKPVADILGHGQALLAAIEHGVSSDVSRLLVEKGMYRETAIHLKRTLLPGVFGAPEKISEHVLNTLSSERNRLGYWVRRQIDPIVDQWSREKRHG